MLRSRIHRGQSLRRAICRRSIYYLLNFSLLSFGQTPHSSNHAAQQLKRWLAAYDAANWDIYSKFLQTNFAPRAENMFKDRSIRNQTGAFDLIKIEKETPTTVSALLSGRDSDKIGRIVIEVEAAEPHRILKLQAQAIDRPSDVSASLE